MVDRRVAGEPLEPVLGWAEFCGLRIHIDSGVFVPRRRTEFLARQACSLVTPGSVVVDMCCGSGAVGVVLQSTLDAVDLYAVDVEPAAVRCARRNITPPERVLEGDLFEPLPTELLGRVDVVVANAPYVPTDSIRLMPPEARLHEPWSRWTAAPTDWTCSDASSRTLRRGYDRVAAFSSRRVRSRSK